MSLHNVTPGAKAPDEFNVIIEIPMNADPIKYEVDHETGALFVDRFMSTAMHYPCNYGYIPNTLSDDGDPVDVLVITPVPLIPGVVVTCRALGMLQHGRRGRWRQQAAGRAHRQDPVDLQPVEEAEDLNPLRLKTIQHFFEHYKDLEPGKWVKVVGWEGPDAARAEIVSGIAGLQGRSRSPILISRARLNGLRSRNSSTYCSMPALGGQEVGHGRGEALVAQPVRRPGAHRHQAARHLVLALRAALEAHESRCAMHHCSGW
jgi:inorganic pyrophosphatase